MTRQTDRNRASRLPGAQAQSEKVGPVALVCSDTGPGGGGETVSVRSTLIIVSLPAGVKGLSKQCEQPFPIGLATLAVPPDHSLAEYLR